MSPLVTGVLIGVGAAAFAWWVVAICRGPNQWTAFRKACAAAEGRRGRAGKWRSQRRCPHCGRHP